MIRRIGLGFTVLSLVLILLAVPAAAHNVTFAAELTVSSDGKHVAFYVADVIRNPVTDADVSLHLANEIVNLTETDLGLYEGQVSTSLANGEGVRAEVDLGPKAVWGGRGKVALGEASQLLLVHVHGGIDGRTFSITMTWVFGFMLLGVLVWEIVRWRRRHRTANAT